MTLKNNPKQIHSKLTFLIIHLFIFSIFMAQPLFAAEKKPNHHSIVELLTARDVRVGGLLGDAMDQSQQGRLNTLTEWQDSRLLRVFSRDSVSENSTCPEAIAGTGWIGEHAGKWMISAARSAARTHDENLKKKLFDAADYLLSQQGEDGYMGTYIPSMRFTSNVRKNFDRTWDIWAHSYNILGLLEIDRYFPNALYRAAAVKMGDLLYNTFYKTGKSVAYRASHNGLSATVVLEPVVELYNATGDQKYLDFAEEIVKQIEARPELELVSGANSGRDASNLGDGKIYQLAWTFVGLAKLCEATGNPDYLNALTNLWNNITTYHLTPGGGPWGGIATHREVFNFRGFWSPYGWLETCNTMSWIHLNRDMLKMTGEAKYAEMIELAAYNSLLGAQYPDGEKWCYFSFPNGCRHAAIYRDCCRSSGMLALEELPMIIYGARDNGLSVNIYTPSEATLQINKKPVKIKQETNYPHDGAVKLTLQLKKSSTFPMFLRIPSWAKNAAVIINGKPVTESITAGSFLTVTRKWKNKDVIELNFPMTLRTHTMTDKRPHRGVNIYSIDWLALSRGPLVYATHGLIFGAEREEKLPLPKLNPESAFTPCENPAGFNGPAYQLKVPGKEPVVFLPYYEAGGRSVGTWRLTWVQADWK